MRELVNQNKTIFENKLEMFNVLDQRFLKYDKELLRQRELIHVNRDKQEAEIHENNVRINLLETKLSSTYDQLEAKVEQTKFWIQKYNETVVNLDSSLGLIKQTLQSSFEKLESENERRLITEDFKRSMKEWNDYLNVKFNE